MYVSPSIWSERNPEVQCQPPCVLVLPPIPLAKPTTISLTPLTTSFLVQSFITEGGSIIEKTVTQQTTISLQPVITTEVEMWAVTLFSQDTTAASFTATPSIMPASTIITLPGSQAIIPIISSGLDPSAFTSTLTQLPVFFASSHTVTIQPQPTVKPTSTPTQPSITYRPGIPKPTCTAACGRHRCNIFGCSGGCAL